MKNNTATQSIYTTSISLVRETVMAPEHGASFILTWGMYWYVLTTIILAILHIQS